LIAPPSSIAKTQSTPDGADFLRVNCDHSVRIGQVRTIVGWGIRKKILGISICTPARVRRLSQLFFLILAHLARAALWAIALRSSEVNFRNRALPPN